MQQRGPSNVRRCHGVADWIRGDSAHDAAVQCDAPLLDVYHHRDGLPLAQHCGRHSFHSFLIRSQCDTINSQQVGRACLVSSWSAALTTIHSQIIHHEIDGKRHSSSQAQSTVKPMVGAIQPRRSGNSSPKWQFTQCHLGEAIASLASTATLGVNTPPRRSSSGSRTSFQASQLDQSCVPRNGRHIPVLYSSKDEIWCTQWHEFIWVSMRGVDAEVVVA